MPTTVARPRRRRTTGRLILAAAVAAGLAASLLTGGDGTPAEAGQAGSGPAAAARGFRATSAASRAPAASAEAVPWTGDLAGQAPCPEGTTRSTQLHREGFEVIPQQQFNNGWYRVTGVEGSYAARALVDSSDPVDHMFLPYVQGTRDTRTMLAFATRSSQADSAYTRAQVNSVDLRVPATGST